MIHLTFSGWWLFGLAFLLVLLCAKDSFIGVLLLLALLLIFLTTLACWVCVHLHWV